MTDIFGQKKKVPGNIRNLYFCLGTEARNAFQKFEYKILYSVGTVWIANNIVSPEKTFLSTFLKLHFFSFYYPLIKTEKNPNFALLKNSISPQNKDITKL